MPTTRQSPDHLSSQHPKIITQANDAMLFIIAHLHNPRHDRFAAIFLNNRNQILHYAELTYDKIDTVALRPREIIKLALLHDATAMIFAHNRPTEDPTPNLLDKQVTCTLSRLFDQLGIRLLDHIIIGTSDFSSVLDYCTPEDGFSKKIRRF